MMFRRVVTGERAGKAVVLADGVAQHTHEFISGMGSSFVWAEPARPDVGGNDPADTVTAETTMLPGIGESRMILLRFPPDTWVTRDDIDLAAAGAEFAEHHPEMAARNEPDNPGMHRTESVDYIVVVEGTISLELDDGERVELSQGDTIIQQGNRHAWRNTSESSATVAVVLVGAERVG